MDPILAEWLSLAIRWVHVMTGIMWIGTSFFFIWLDASLRHYQAPKPGIAGYPARLESELKRRLPGREVSTAVLSLPGEAWLWRPF